MKSSQIVPLQDWCLVRKIRTDQTEGGIYLTEKTQDAQADAKVIAIGPGRIQDGKLIEPRVKKGDKVIIDPRVIDGLAGIEVKDGPEREVMFFVSESAVVCIVTEDEPGN